MMYYAKESKVCQHQVDWLSAWLQYYIFSTETFAITVDEE